MRKSVVLPIIVLAASCIGTMAFAEKWSKNPGEAKFKELCAMCHPDGGNIINSKKTLNKKDREAHGIKSAAEIIKIIRTPGPGMLAFDAKTVPDKDANEIAQYILKTFTY